MPEYEYGCELHFPVLSAVGRAKQEEAVKQTEKQTLKSQQKNTTFTQIRSCKKRTKYCCYVTILGYIVTLHCYITLLR